MHVYKSYIFVVSRWGGGRARPASPHMMFQPRPSLRFQRDYPRAINYTHVRSGEGTATIM